MTDIPFITEHVFNSRIENVWQALTDLVSGAIFNSTKH